MCNCTASTHYCCGGRRHKQWQALSLKIIKLTFVSHCSLWRCTERKTCLRSRTTLALPPSYFQIPCTEQAEMCIILWRTRCAEYPFTKAKKSRSQVILTLWFYILNTYWYSDHLSMFHQLLKVNFLLLIIFILPAGVETCWKSSQVVPWCCCFGDGVLRQIRRFTYRFVVLVGQLWRFLVLQWPPVETLWLKVNCATGQVSERCVKSTAVKIPTPVR